MDYKKQAIYNTAGNLIYMACLWVMSVLVARISGFSDAGTFSIAMTIGNIFYFIAMYGIRSFQASDVKEEYGDVIYFKTRVVTVLISILGCCIYLIICDYDAYTSLAVLIYTIFRGIEALSDVIFGELQRVGHLEVSGISMSIKGVISVVVFSIILMYTQNLDFALLGIVIIALLFLIFYDYKGYVKYRSPSRKKDQGNVMELLIKGFPMLLTTVFPIVVTAIPRLALEQYYGTEMLGIYSSIATPTVLLTTIIPNMLCPFMTYYGICYQKGQYKKLLLMMWISIFCSALLGALACILAYFLGDIVMGTIFGDAILPYLYVFIPLIIATTVYAFSMCGNSVLITIRYPMWLTLFAFLALVVSIIITPMLVQQYFMHGTVLAFAIPFAVQFILQVIFVSYKLLKKNENR